MGGTYLGIATYPTVSTILADQLGDTFYLPLYEVSPYEIFADKVALFDVNFFNPKENEKYLDWKDTKEEDVNLEYGIYLEVGNPIERTYDLDVSNKDEDGKTEYEKFEEKYKFNKNTAVEGESKTNIQGTITYIEYTWTNSNDGKKYIAWIESGEHKRVKNNYNDPDITVKTIRDIKEIIPTEKTRHSTAGFLQSTLSAWYVTLRNLALVALLSVLVYIGIRITISSVASDKAKYKQMLIDWTVAICLVFLMHYIMSFAVTINSKITEMLTSMSISNENYEEIVEQLPDEAKDLKKEVASAVKLYKISGYKKNDNGQTVGDLSKINGAWDVLIGNEGKAVEGEETSIFRYCFFKDEEFEHLAEQKSEAKFFIWPANNFIEQARMEFQILKEGGEERLLSYGYGIIYVVLIIYTIIFSFTYLRRVLYMAFLTMIAPLVAVTYPIDKLNDGQAQAFNMWIKEYIFNLLIQPLHLALYMIVIGSAMEFAATNVFYAIMALGFLIPSEKLLRRFFGFEKAQTPGAFGGAAGAALMMSGLNTLMRGGKGGSGSSGGSSKGSEDGENKKPSIKDKNFDATQHLIGNGEDKENNTPEESTEGPRTVNNTETKRRNKRTRI